MVKNPKAPKRIFDDRSGYCRWAGFLRDFGNRRIPKCLEWDSPIKKCTVEGRLGGGGGGGGGGGIQTVANKRLTLDHQFLRNPQRIWSVRFFFSKLACQRRREITRTPV